MLRFNIIFEINNLLGDYNIKILNGFFGQYLQKRSKTINEHQHRILHIQISLRSKFQLQQTILIF